MEIRSFVTEKGSAADRRNDPAKLRLQAIALQAFSRSAVLAPEGSIGGGRESEQRGLPCATHVQLAESEGE
jgi:hypothetical protein